MLGVWKVEPIQDHSMNLPRGQKCQPALSWALVGCFPKVASVDGCHTRKILSATHQQGEICVNISVVHTVFGVTFWWNSPIRSEFQQFTSDFTTHLVEKNGEKFTPHFCRVLVLKILMENWPLKKGPIGDLAGYVKCGQDLEHRGSVQTRVPRKGSFTSKGFCDHESMTGGPGHRTMEMNGGSSALYLACTPCVPLFCTLIHRGGNRRAFRLRGAGGDHFHCTVEPLPGHIRCRMKRWSDQVKAMRADEDSFSGTQSTVAMVRLQPVLLS